MAKVKVGVIGCGAMGSFHVKTAGSHPDAKLIGAFDADQSKASEIAAKYSTTSFSSIEQLLEKVEAIVVATPTSTHPEIASIIISKKKHLLVEKPLSLDSTTSETITNEAERNNCILAVGMIERFNPAFTKAFSIVKNEKILGIEIKRFSPYPARISDASVVWDMMIHDIDLLSTMAKSPLDSIKASGKKTKSELLDEVDSTFYFKDGLIARISCNRGINEKVRKMVITTDHAIYDVDLLEKKLYKRNYGSLSNKEEIVTIIADQLWLEHKDFYSAIRKNRPPKCTGNQAIYVAKLAEEVEQKCLSH
ncbi:Gfo/Idh/MocA family oxidoreductase [Candidatus Saganbacteria bacterium]|nr:Gfo/Idh/MocA family oxidoreductase [Candidatus Saganbacteria bacterium]